MTTKHTAAGSCRKLGCVVVCNALIINDMEDWWSAEVIADALDITVEECLSYRQ